MIGQLVALLGSLFVLLAAVGVVRFDDVLARMHALAKASTLGVLLMLFGAAVSLDHPNDVTSLVLAGLLQILTSPPASNLLSRAVYLADGIPSRIDTIDEGAARRDVLRNPPG
jgi:multicomponent Na+:H+ antiporter subunit G